MKTPNLMLGTERRRSAPRSEGVLRSSEGSTPWSEAVLEILHHPGLHSTRLSAAARTGTRLDSGLLLDVILEEDDRPWTRHPHGMVVVKLLRRVAFNLLSLFRGVYLRSEENRALPWRKVIAPFYDTVRTADGPTLRQMARQTTHRLHCQRQATADSVR